MVHSLGSVQHWTGQIIFFLDPANQSGVSSADRVLSEFWVSNTLFFKLGVELA
jgi:hypothetical protein